MLRRAALNLVSGLIGLAVTAIPVMAVTIDFDDIVVGGVFRTVPADQYLSEGILFDQPIEIVDVEMWSPPYVGEFVAGGGTLPNAWVILASLQFEATFVIPGTSIPTTIDSIVLHVFDTNVGTTFGTLEAFDLHGTLLATITETNTGGATTYEVSESGIARIRITDDGDGAFWDNIVFEPNGSTPVESKTWGDVKAIYR